MQTKIKLSSLIYFLTHLVDDVYIFSFPISETCYCDGTEHFKCDRIKSNMKELCFKKPDEDILSNEIEVDRLKGSKSSASSLQSKLERILILITVFVGLFVTYLSACVNAMISDFTPTSVQAEAMPITNPDPLF